MSSDLVELGQQVVAEVSSSVANGAPLVKCQLWRPHSTRRCSMSCGRPMLPSAARCLPLPTSVIESRAPISVRSQCSVNSGELLAFWKSLYPRQATAVATGVATPPPGN
jgi:hypothetical protein